MEENQENNLEVLKWKRSHSVFSPSSADRWMSCTKSAQLSAVFPDLKEPNQERSEGTEAHEVASFVLGGGDIPVSGGDMYDYAYEYRQYVNNLTQGCCGLGIEAKIYHKNIPDMFGTVDCYATTKDGKTCYIVDYKYGEHVLVEAENNMQLFSYAMIIKSRHPTLENFHLVIFQPRAGGVTEWKFGIEEYSKKEKDVLAAIEKIKSGNTNYKIGDYCTWCPVFSLCREQERKFNEVLQIGQAFNFPEPEGMRPWELERVVAIRSQLTKWMDNCNELALRLAKGGYDFKELKLVKGRSMRVWNGEPEAIASQLISLGIIEPYQIKLKSLTAVEKEIGKGKIDELVVKTEPGVKLVHVTSPGEPVRISQEILTDIFKPE